MNFRALSNIPFKFSINRLLSTGAAIKLKPMNDSIPVEKFTLITANGPVESTLEEAMKLVNLETHNLVLVSSQPAIARILEIESEVKKRMLLQKPITKAIKKKKMEISLLIAPHDLETKMNQSKVFLQKSYYVEFTLTTKKQPMFTTLYKQISTALAQDGRVHGRPKQVGKKLIFEIRHNKVEL